MVATLNHVSKRFRDAIYICLDNDMSDCRILKVNPRGWREYIAAPNRTGNQRDNDILQYLFRDLWSNHISSISPDVTRVAVQAGNMPYMAHLVEVVKKARPARGIDWDMLFDGIDFTQAEGTPLAEYIVSELIHLSTFGRWLMNKGLRRYRPSNLPFWTKYIADAEFVSMNSVLFDR